MGWTDFLINVVALAVVPGIVALVGNYVAANGLPAEQIKMRRRIKFWFALLFVTGIIMTAWQQYRVALAEEGKPNSSVAALRNAFPWLVSPPQPTTPSTKQPAKISPLPLHDIQPIVHGLPREFVARQLREQASQIQAEFKEYWTVEDEELEIKEKTLREQPVKPTQQIEEIEKQRATLKSFFGAELEATARGADALRAEAMELLPTRLHTSIDNDEELIFDAVSSGASKPTQYDTVQHLVDYLNSLAARLDSLPAEDIR
jgi:hypothetical protein